VIQNAAIVDINLFYFVGIDLSLRSDWQSPGHVADINVKTGCMYRQTCLL